MDRQIITASFLRSKAHAMETTQTLLKARAASHIRRADRVSAGNLILEKLGASEVRRRIWHMAPGLLPLVLWVCPRDCYVDFFQVLPASATLLAERTFRMENGFALLRVSSIAVIVVCFAIAAICRQSTIARKGERNALASVLGYSGTVLLMLLLFPRQSALGVTVLGVLAFGDGSATLGGMLLRGPTLPWNRNKTWAGAACFLLCAAPIATLFYWAECRFCGTEWQIDVSLAIAMACGMTATVVAGIVESLPSRINDNIRVGVATSVSLAVMHGLLVGWA